MKRTIAAGFIAALAFAGLAEPVSREQAETAARAWVRDGHAVGERLSPEVGDVREVRFSDDGLPLYVADFAGGGFAVLASDTLCEPVVFYSGSGAFPSDPEHPIHALMAAEGRRLAQTVAAGGEPKPLWSRLLAPSRPRLLAASPAALSDSEIRVAPLVKTHWNQQTFNDCTPGNKKGNITSGYFPLGCGPTALTQVMYTLRWPQDAVEPFSCTQSSISWADGTSEWRQFTAVGGTYDWDEMPLTYSEVRVNKEVRGRMAKFGLDVAIAFATQWREKSAGVTSAAVELWHGPMALTNFFHYSNAQFLSNTNSPGSSALPTELVIRAMKSNLDAHIPVLVEVHGTPGGHEIIADGYGYKNGTFYGHFNFGWAGTGDGWYVIPDIQDFSSVSGVMYNIFTTQPAGSSIASGRVLLSSAPVEGATVSAYDGEKRLVGTATTDANGNYALIIPPGDYDLVARKTDVLGELRSVTLGRCSGYSSAKWNSSGYYSAAVLPPEGIICGNVCDADITMTAPEPGAAIAIPSGAAGLVYTGAAQVGVPGGVSYTVEGGSATDAGDHVATATLRPGYTWDDGTDGPRQVTWTIARATLVATAQNAECEAGDPVPNLSVSVKGFVNGETAATAAGYAAPSATTSYTSSSSAGEYPITVAGGAAKNYAFAYRDATLTVTEELTDWGLVFNERLLKHIIAHPEKHINETYTLDPAPSLSAANELKAARVGFLEFGDKDVEVSTDGRGRLRITLSYYEDLLPWGHLTVVDDVPSDAQIIVVGQYPGALWFAPNVTVHGGVNRVTTIETVSTRIRQSMQTTSGSGTLYLDGSGKGIEFKSIDAKTNADGEGISCNNGTAGTFVLSGNVTLAVKDTGTEPDYDVLIDGGRPETDADGNAWSSSGSDLHVFVSGSGAADDPWNPPAPPATVGEVVAEAVPGVGYAGSKVTVSVAGLVTGAYSNEDFHAAFTVNGKAYAGEVTPVGTDGCRVTFAIDAEGEHAVVAEHAYVGVLELWMEDEENGRTELARRDITLVQGTVVRETHPWFREVAPNLGTDGTWEKVGDMLRIYTPSNAMPNGAAATVETGFVFSGQSEADDEPPPDNPQGAMRIVADGKGGSLLQVYAAVEDARGAMSVGWQNANVAESAGYEFVTGVCYVVRLELDYPSGEHNGMVPLVCSVKTADELTFAKLFEGFAVTAQTGGACTANRVSRAGFLGEASFDSLTGEYAITRIRTDVGPTVDGVPVAAERVFEAARTTRPIAYPSAPVVTGEVGAQKIVFGGVTVSVPRHYTATLSDNTVLLALNDFARPVVSDGDGDRKAITVGETTVSLHIGNAIEGLFYRVVSVTALGDEWTPVTEFLPVSDFTVDRKPTDTSAFYKIEVSDVQKEKE